MLYYIFATTCQATGHRAQISSDQVGASAFHGASDPFSCIGLLGADGKNQVRKKLKNLEIESLESTCRVRVFIHFDFDCSMFDRLRLISISCK